MKNFKKPDKFDRNLIVIGAGSAGLVTAYIAAAVKAKVTLIEKNKMGGDCLNTGCVPSKAFLRSAKYLSHIQRANEFGFHSANVDYDFADVMQRIQDIIKTIEPHDSVERYTELGVECLQGAAEIISPWEVRINDQTLTARNLVIATGARPFIPPIKGIDQINYLTSDNVWHIKNRPQRLVVLGGGPIGCELSQGFARFGSKVTQVEMLPSLLNREDKEVSDLVEKKFRREGIDTRLNHRALEIRIIDNEKILLCEHEGQTVNIPFDEILVAVGRKANTSGFGLEKVGVDLTATGTIKVNDYLQTSVDSIFACGDVAGPYQFTHTAAHQAWYASVNTLFGSLRKFKVDYSVIPWTTFTDPEVARVGINEVEAKGNNIDHEVTHYSMSELDRAITESETEGFIRIITEKGKDKILGATIVGDHAGELLTEYVSAMKHKYGLNDILGTIHSYPTLSEANKFVAGNWKKNHAPEWIFKFIKKFHEWKRS